MAVISADALSGAHLKAVEVGPSPLPGRSRPVGLDYVRIRLRQAKVDPTVLAAESAAQCVVTRSAQTLTSDALIECARTFMEANIEAGDGKLVIEPSSRPKDVVLPVGLLALSAELAPASITGATRRVTVAVTVDGAPAVRVDVSLRVRRYAKVAVAKTTIARGALVTADLVAYEERDRMSLPPDVLCEGDSLDGLQAQQAIAANAPLTKRTATPPPVIRVGDTVTIVAGGDGIKISTPGVSDENGQVGQTIRVRNTGSNAEFRATVVDAKTVEAVQ
jgi:flagella basal body P-ring formation protein FlgA